MHDATEAVKLDPARAPLALACRAEARLLSTAGDRDPERAVADCDEAIAGDGSAPSPTPCVGWRGGSFSRFSAAAADFDRAGGLDPTLAAVPAYRAAVSVLAGDGERAVRESNAALALDPLAAARASRRAKQLLLLPDEALADAKEAIRLDSYAEGGYATLVDILTARGDHEQALAALSEVVRAEPHNAVARCFRGEVNLAHRDPAEAGSDFTEAARLNPTYCRAWTGLVNAARLRNDLAALSADLDGKIKAAPGSRNCARPRATWRPQVTSSGPRPPRSSGSNSTRRTPWPVPASPTPSATAETTPARRRSTTS